MFAVVKVILLVGSAFCSMLKRCMIDAIGRDGERYTADPAPTAVEYSHARDRNKNESAAQTSEI